MQGVGVRVSKGERYRVLVWVSKGERYRVLRCKVLV